MLEAKTQKLIHLALSEAGLRLFRQNVGMGWVGKILSKTATQITLGNPRPLHAGLCKGSLDLVGWTSVTITPDMVGSVVAVFTAVDAKRLEGGQTSEDQAAFIAAVQRAGGIAGIAASPEEALSLLAERGAKSA